MRDFTGHVYFISTECETKVKIGMTTDSDPSSRISSIQTGSPQKLKLMHSIRCEGVNPRYVERDLHSVFSAYRLHGEWFHVCGTLAYFLDEAMSHEMHHKALQWGKRDHAWTLAGKDGLPQLTTAMGSKTPTCDPYNTALYVNKITKDPVKTENAALRVIVSELISENAHMAAVLNAYKRAGEVMETYESEYRQRANGGEFSGIASMLVRDSDANLEALSYAHGMMNEEDHFYGDAIHYCFPPDKK